MTPPSFDRIDISRLSPQSRWALENLAVRHRLDDVDLQELADEHDITRRIAKRMLDVLDAEVRAQQVGAELPELAKSELAALEAQLIRWGQVYPIVRIRVRGRVVAIDGSSREELLGKLELPIEYRDVDVKDKDEARSLALALNIARRQLDGKVLRSLAAAEVVHDPSRSDRAIAEVLGVSHMTVGRARRELEKLGLVEHSSTRVGRDDVVQRITEIAPSRREDKLTEIFSELRELAKSDDRSSAHMRADRLAVEALKLLGAEAIAEIFEKVVKRS